MVEKSGFASTHDANQRKRRSIMDRVKEGPNKVHFQYPSIVDIFVAMNNKIVSGRNKLEAFAKDVGTKTVRKHLGRGKMSSYTQEVFPSTSLDESSIEFEFETDRNLYSDMRDTHISLKLQLFNGRLIDAFKKEKAEHKAKSEEDSDEEPQTYLTYVNNLLHSLFSNCEVYFNCTMVYYANGLYPH